MKMGIMHNSESNFFHLEKVKFLGVVALLKVLKSTHFQTLLCFYFKRLNNALHYNNNKTYFNFVIFLFFSPIWDEDDDDELIESECKQCRQFYTPDQRLPDWMSRASCQKCLIWSCDNAGAKSKVVFCQYCRQGKFGWVKCSKNRSVSICVNCVDRTKAYVKMSQESHVQTYVKGMLNELVSVIF